MLHAAIVGYGNIGPTHAAGLKTVEFANLSVICDIQADRAKIGAAEYGCRAVSDYDEVLKDGSVDVVHVCTPHYLHKDMAVKALSAGKHVVLEKPLSMNKAELKELISAQETFGKKVCVMFQNRKNNAVQVLKELTDSKKFGKLLAISGFMTWDRDEAYYAQDEWRGKWATEGGGVLINQSVHLLDLMGYIGGKIEAVKASISTKRLAGVVEVEDTADALLFYENGMRGCFYASNAYATTTPFQLTAEFELGRIRYSDNFLYEIKNGEAPRIVAGNDMNTPGKSCWGSGHAQVIDEFYKALENETDDYLALSTGVDTSNLLFSIYESAKDGGKQVKLTD